MWAKDGGKLLVHQAGTLYLLTYSFPLSVHVRANVAGWFRRRSIRQDISLEQGYEAAKLTALGILASLRRELGNLENLTCLRVFDMVNVAAEFQSMPAVINGFSDLILSVFGPERGQHTRSAIGVAELPFGIPVEIEAEVVLD